MANPVENFLIQAIQVVKFIGKLNESSQSLIVKCSDNVNGRLERKLDNNIRDEQPLTFTQNGFMLVEGSELNIEIHKKHFQQQKIRMLGRTSKEELMCKASIRFDDLWKHVSSRTEMNSNFEVKFDNPIQGLQLWLVIEVRDIDLNTLDPQIKKMMVELNELQSVLHRSTSASDVARMVIDLGTAASKLNPVAHAVFSCIQVVYQHLKTQEESHEAMKSLAESIQVLSGQLSRLREVTISEQMCHTFTEFPIIMEEVINFIRRWLESWMFKYIFVDSQKEKAIALRSKLDAFKDKFDRDLSIEIHIAQTEKKELDDLIRALGENRLPLRKPCMHGTRTAILQDIESNIKNVNDLSVIWIRGSPGVGKSALAASMAARLRKLDRHLISFRFDHTQSAIITTDALWRAIALDLARLFPSVRQHIHNLVRGNRMPDPSDIDDRFRTLIETPLSTLNDVPPEKLPIIVIDALDECGGLRHDSSGRDDFESLMHTLKRWVQVDHLKKLKLIITSRPENRITKIFPKSISVHVNIPSGSDVKLGDSVSNDIHAFLKSRLNDMEMKPAWITKALDFLVPGAAGIFIWVTTVANFLERDPEGRFAMLKKGDGKGLKSLYSLYSTIVKASFGYDLEVEEIRAVVSVMGAMIFARQPLDDNALIMLPEVKIPGSDTDRLGLIRKGLVSVIDSGPILRFHHRSFEDFLLSPSFLQEHPELLAIQDHVHQERQLTVLSLKTLVSSKLHFNMCSLESSFVFNKNIQAAAKTTIPPLVSYSCQYWADHLIFTPSDEMLVDAVKFVMYEKLLFWMEVMSLLGKAYEVALILKRALAWKTLNPGHELTLFIHDALRFISAFIIPISQCAPQIYVSALSFTPDQSLITKKFCSRFPNTIVVTEGKPSQWPMVLFTAEHHGDGVRPVFFSTNESIFASISGYCNKTICVCDAETGHCISGPFQLPYDAHIYNACFSPDMKHILLQFKSDAVVLDIVTGEEQFWIKGLDFVFIHHDGRIVFIDEIDEDGNFIAWGEEQGGRPTHIPVKSWDANNGFEVDGVACTRFSPDGRFLAVGRKSESVIELWSLEDGKDPRQFLYPPGNNLSSLHFSPTSDSLMAVFMEKPSHIYLWRLDTQEMASFSHDFTHVPHVIHSPLTNYLVIRRYNALEIWDVSVTGSKLIWKTTEAPTHIWSTCPSRDGHRLLVGYDDGKVKMWDLDLENLAINQADTMDTQDDTDLRRVILISRSGKMVATEAKRSRSIDFLDTTTGEVISHMNFANHTGIVFSPEEDQAVFWSKSLITICDIMHPDNRVSFDLWPGKDVQVGELAFQTCNDLVICAISCDDLGLLQVWHRQDPTGFECMYSVNFKVEGSSRISLAPDGLTVIIFGNDDNLCYSWNHNTAQFHLVNFNNQVHIPRFFMNFLPISLPKYSPDGKLFAYWSCNDFHVRAWDTRTGQQVSQFQVSPSDEIAIPPLLIGLSHGKKLIVLWQEHRNIIRLFDVYTGHLYAQILGQGRANMTFIKDGTKLAYFSSNFGLRIWDIADLMDEHWHFTHGYELILKEMVAGWVMGRDYEPLFWVPDEHRDNLYVPSPRAVFGIPSKKATSVDLSYSRLGRKWTECIDKEWLRELERKEKEVEDLLEK